MDQSRENVLEYIEVAIVELRGKAQPRDIADLRELALDARDADSAESLAGILAQAQNLRKFCELRAMSREAMPRVVAPPARRL